MARGSMRRAWLWAGALGVGAISALGGCVVTPPAPVTVVLANRTGTDLTPKFFSSASATTTASLFVYNNRLVDFNNRAFDEMRAGEVITLNFDCEELRSMGVQRPFIFDPISLTIGRLEDEVFLLRDNGFQCGDLVRFVYDTDENGALTLDVEFE
ncbi:MAG: hypothetical protein KDA32_01265 [Phycisphaerales bacterium]|nr:hypothetical protein [Phycisphaerales bacterium]